MIAGTVRNREAVISLEVLGSDGKRLRIDAVIDTGFNGYLTLPSATVVALKLTFAGNRRGILADGSVTILDVYLATVGWHGREREVLISQTVGTPLVGMSLLEGSNLLLTVIDGGNVTVTELPLPQRPQLPGDS